eukprot:1152079-Pelagomonas_calceolata.AAC.22
MVAASRSPDFPGATIRVSCAAATLLQRWHVSHVGRLFRSSGIAVAAAAVAAAAAAAAARRRQQGSWSPEQSHPASAPSVPHTIEMLHFDSAAVRHPNASVLPLASPRLHRPA